MKEAQLKKDLDAESSVWYFLGKGCLTGGFYFAHWMLSSLKNISINSPHFVDFVKKTKIGAWGYVVLLFFVSPMLANIMVQAATERDYELLINLSIISSCSALAAVVFLIYAAVTMRSMLKSHLERMGIMYDIKMVWTVIFNVIYLYYVINNCDKVTRASTIGSMKQESKNDDVLAKLEKLNALKEKSAISEEEYEAYKKKLLS